MKIDAVGIASSNMQNTIKFYSLLGFNFKKPDGEHVEPETPEGSARLMIDDKEFLKTITNEVPTPGSQSGFAINYDSAEEVNSIAVKVSEAGYKVFKQPWDAPWGQRYCVVEDPDGYKVDLYSNL